jgi:hydroxyacyl-ACP dehydratase HTD2-like protein with hotdog domain
VQSKGKEGEEKLFVRIERRIARVSKDEVDQLAAAEGDEEARNTLEHRVRQRLWRDQDTDFGPCSVIETRNIVFLRPRSKEQAAAEAAKTFGKKLRPQREAEWSHTVLPDPKLLFRFSALTFNAHAIHLDPQYCREVEGHKERLFHGPLSFVFMITLLQQELRRQGKGEMVREVEYRNLAPLYCNEEVRFCGARSGEGKWEVWSETPEGGVAVKGTVVTGRE